MKITDHEMLVTIASMALKTDDLTSADVLDTFKQLGFESVISEARKIDSQDATPIIRAARVLAERALTDSMIRLDQAAVRELLSEESVSAGYVPTDEQCEQFITGDELGDIPPKLAADFPRLHAYLDSVWSGE